VSEGLRGLRVELARLNHRVSERVELRDIDLDCLDLIARAGGLTPKKLALLSGVHPATLTGIVDRLEGQGWVVRERDEADRRSVVLRPAPGSASRVLKQFEGMRAALDEACSDFSDEQLAVIQEFLRRATIASGSAADAL
jgi:DNA-binding MarR family transcriptional regulator